MARILIVEDDLIMADMVELVLRKAGHQVCGIARTVAEAVVLGNRYVPDLTIIDVRLASEGVGTDLATVSDAVGQSAILYATANPSAVVMAAAPGHACITKPYSFPNLLRSIELAAELKATGTASAPYPHGFQVLLQPLHGTSSLHPHG